MAGIDNMYLYVPPVCVTSSCIQEGRDYSERQAADVGFTRRSLVPCIEDTLTMAVNAARKVIDDPAEYGLIIVGTESGFDFGKPISTYVQKYLNLPNNCRNFEVKHACYSGTAAMLMALSWLQNPANKDKKALVVMSDFSRDHLNDISELTTGSGAVALSLSNSPRLIEIHSETGCACHEVFDVARPTKDFEWGDPMLSLFSYIDLTEMAWERLASAINCIHPAESFKAMLYHMPLMSLVRKAHFAVLDNCDEMQTQETMQASFNDLVLPAAVYNLETSNIYSGSLYVSLLGCLAETEIQAHDHIALFSYGSGACSEFFHATVQTQAKALCQAMKLRDWFDGRTEVSFAEYESIIREQQVAYQAKDYTPNEQVVASLMSQYYEPDNLLRLVSIENYYRTYAWSQDLGNK